MEAAFGLRLGKSRAIGGLAVSRALSQVCCFTGVRLNEFFNAIALNPCYVIGPPNLPSCRESGKVLPCCASRVQLGESHICQA